MRPNSNTEYNGQSEPCRSINCLRIFPSRKMHPLILDRGSYLPSSLVDLGSTHPQPEMYLSVPCVKVKEKYRDTYFK